MDNDLKCNRLNCRKPLTDKAVVTTCSHIFCVDCANELFNASRMCPACETTLMEPDDVVVCSLNPSNDYKTSVLSGLSPSTILEICSRAISFWQYQMQQESSFQAAVVRNVNDKSALLQKQLDSVIREANGEIALLNDKVKDLQRDLEIERRKIRELHESYREKEKEYTKLKALHDQMKRKALLTPANPLPVAEITDIPLTHKPTQGPLDITIGAMNTAGRTPLVTRNPGGPINGGGAGNWHKRGATSNPNGHLQNVGNRSAQRQAFNPLMQNPLDSRSYTSTSQRSESLNEMNEVENQLMGYVAPNRHKNAPPPPAWAHPSPVSARGSQRAQRGFPQATKHTPGTFRPSVITR